MLVFTVLGTENKKKHVKYVKEKNNNNQQKEMKTHLKTKRITYNKKWNVQKKKYIHTHTYRHLFIQTVSSIKYLLMYRSDYQHFSINMYMYVRYV